MTAIREILQGNVGHYGRLSKAQRVRLRRDVAAMVAGKTWEGCGGLCVTDEIRVTIAGQACLMLLGREHDCFGRVPSILVYPSGFQAVDERWQEHGWSPVAASGQAVHRGPVILAWDSVLTEGREPECGYNVVIHEFAHQVDFVECYADGTLDLALEGAERYRDMFETEYHRHERAVRRGRETFLGEYAATNHGEFFATASECFFTVPAKLRHYHPELYEVLGALYAVDPLEWFGEGGRF
jgi:MtfA peptidase